MSSISLAFDDERYIIHEHRNFYSSYLPHYFQTTDKELAILVFMKLLKNECSFGDVILSTVQVPNVFTSAHGRNVVRSM